MTLCPNYGTSEDRTMCKNQRKVSSQIRTHMYPECYFPHKLLTVFLPEIKKYQDDTMHTCLKIIFSHYIVWIKINSIPRGILSRFQGFGITPRMVRVRVGRIVRQLGIKTPFKARIPGKDWMTAFIKRHPDISLQSLAPLSTARANMLNEVVVSQYFDCLRDVLNSLNLIEKPKCIWNIDETSVPLTHKLSKVLGATGAKNIPGRVGNCRDNVSVLACVNADGGKIPPMITVKGKTYKVCMHIIPKKVYLAAFIYTRRRLGWRMFLGSFGLKTISLSSVEKKGHSL